MNVWIKWFFICCWVWLQCMSRLIWRKEYWIWLTSLNGKLFSIFKGRRGIRSHMVELRLSRFFDDLDSLFWCHFFFTNFNLSHQRSVTTFSRQTKQMYWNSVDTILLVQLWRIIKLVTYTVAAWKKFMYSRLAHKTFLYILWQIFPLLHNGLRLSFNSCVILIQCWVFNFILHIFDYANSWLSGLFGPVHTSGNNQGAMVLCNSGTSDYAALVILCRTLQHTLELDLCRGNKQWRSSLRISTLVLR